jgi:hypothetical protein
MKRKHHGFACVFDSSRSMNPGDTSRLPSGPLLFHIVRGQHMMPNLIRSCYDWVHVSKAKFCLVQLFRIVVAGKQLRRLGGQSSDSDIAIMMSRCDLQPVDMQIHISRNVR